MREDLDVFLSGPLSGALGWAPAQTLSPPGRTPVVPTQGRWENDVSGDFTVVEVMTEDRPGVPLRDYADAVHGRARHPPLEDPEEANRAIDVLYVRDKAAMEKVTDPARQHHVRETLLGLLAVVGSSKLSGGTTSP